jgi:hypothetical protein
VDLNDVNAAFRGFPYPLAGLTGHLFFDRENVTITDVVSRKGERQIRLNGKVTGWSGGRPGYYISVEGKDIPLDAALREALPPRHRELFHRCGLGGRADVQARVFNTSAAGAPAGPAGPNDNSPGRPRAGGDANGVGPDPDAADDVSFLAEVVCREGTVQLPLASSDPAGSGAPPSTGTGPVGGRSLAVSDIAAEATITPRSLSIRKLHGRHGRSPVTMTGSVQFGQDDALRQCHMRVTAQQVPLEETTMGLLPPSLTRQIAAFHPEGDVNIVVDLDQAGSGKTPQYAVVVDCLGDRIHHERFDYPLHDVRGEIAFQKDSITLKNVTARPQDGPVSAPSPAIRVDGVASLAQGTIEQGSFTVTATDLRFTDELGRALPTTLAGPYRDLSPQGLFDLDLTTLKVSRAAPGDTLVEFGGKVKLGPGSGNLSSEQKVAREDPSVPRSLGTDSSASACVLKVSGTAVELSGALEAEGSYSTKRGLAKGRVGLAAERLAVEGKAATHTKVEAVYDPNAQKWLAKDFLGDCYGGRLLGRLEIGPAAAPAGEPREEARDLPGSTGLEYLLQMAFNDVDLRQFLLAGPPQAAGQKTPDRGQTAEGGILQNLVSVLHPSSSGPSSTSSGVMDAWLSLSARIGDDARPGTGGGGSSGVPRRGVCHVEIADMQVGKVSPLGHVLSVLRLNEPTDYTFDRMLIDSYIRADKLLISKLDLSGRSAAFTGSGTMDLPTEEINLTLTARGARVARAEPSVLQSLTEGLGGAVVRMEVTGKAGSPHVQTKALPVIEDSLRLLGTPEEGKKGKK